MRVDAHRSHLKSQILSWNSKIFKGLIGKNRKLTDPTLQSVSGNEAASEICLEDTIPVEDLRELLHYIYFPFEPVDEHNLKQLLHWGKKFEVNHIVQLCQQFMESMLKNPQTTEDSKREIFLLSWKYSIEPLKKIYAINVIPHNSAGWMKNIVRSELYQDMDNELKPKMWEFLIEKSKCL
ncbi:unnamed protein product [Auanema sp. JU1783]|nr:unnamed protein product [Auanema sp. JU1783]